MSAIPLEQTSTAALRDEVLTKWHALEIYNYYRVFLAVTLLTMNVMDFAYITSSGLFPELSRHITILYTVFSIISLIFVSKRVSSVSTVSIVHCCGDIFALGMLMLALPPALTSLAVLLNVCIAANSLLLGRKGGLFLASIATFVLVGNQLVVHPEKFFTIQDALWSGILSTSFFFTTTLTYIFALQVKKRQAITSQHQVDLKNLEELNAYIIERMPSGVVVVDYDERVRLMNRAAVKAFRKHEQPNYLYEVSQELANQHRKWREHQLTSTSEQRLLLASPELAVHLTSLGSCNSQGTLILIDEMSSMVERAQQMKLASLGRFTASIAHELRNPLGAISHAVQLLDETISKSKEERRLFDIVYQQNERMNNVVKNILHLSRRSKTKLESFDLINWIEQFKRRYVENSTENIEFSFVTNIKNTVQYFDTSQLEQILTNLCDNGLRASYDETGRYAIFVDVILNKATSETRLEVVDEGAGVLEDQLEKIFEPFYTTKHDGNGLGLYISNELCQANFAQLDCTRHVSKGACFSITFRTMVGTNDKCN